ncbi:MAG: hypothetical protein ACWA40_02585 [Planktomarina sp.]
MTRRALGPRFAIAQKTSKTTPRGKNIVPSARFLRFASGALDNTVKR